MFSKISNYSFSLNNNYNFNGNRTNALNINKNFTTDTFVKTSFKGDFNTTKFDEAGEIKSEKEYDLTLQKLMNDKSWNKNWNISNANKYQLGLMPYVGILDIHSEMNYFLRNGKLYHHELINNIVKDEDTMMNYIKVMKYALKELDKEYGTHNGIVYRYGYFKNSDTKSTGYVSTALNPEGVIQVACSGERPFKQPYFIIIAKDGHKIINMQEKMNYPDTFKKSYITESEILLDPNKSYEKITEKTPELEKAEKDLFEAFKKKYPNINENVLKNNLHIYFYKEC